MKCSSDSFVNNSDSVVNTFIDNSVYTERDVDHLIDLHNRIHSSKLYNYTGLQIPLMSNLNIRFWVDNLQDYEHNMIVSFMEYGWPIE